MIIITDDKEYSEKIFKLRINWQKQSDGFDKQNFTNITEELFTAKNLFFAQIKSDPIWKFVFIVKHAATSQFSTLIKLSQSEPDLPEGILCFARSGDNFKGYRERNWVSLPGNIHLSAYLKPNQPVEHFHVGFTILSAISVVQAIDKVDQLKYKAQIKWVNDILISEKKVSGVLTHTQTKGKNVTDLFIGIGINIDSTPHLKGDFIVGEATSLNANLNHQQRVTQSFVVENLLQALSVNYSLLLKNQYLSILDWYRNRSYIIGKRVEVYSDPLKGDPEKTNEGKVISIGQNLELYLENQKEPVTKGRVMLIR